MATYIAYCYGKANQSFAMKNEKNETVFEANLTKFRFFGHCDYEFVNKKTLKTESHKIGKTKTMQMGFGNTSFNTSSYFNFDGRNVFKVLESKGYNLKLTKFGPIHPEFTLIDSEGNQVATYKLNVTGERQEGVRGIGHLQKNTIITTDSTDLEAIFLVAFIFSRVNISATLM